MRGKTLSRKWVIEMKYAAEGLALQRSYRREVETGVLFRICRFDGTTVGKPFTEGTFDEMFPLFRDMIRTARDVGPWDFEV